MEAKTDRQAFSSEVHSQTCGESRQGVLVFFVGKMTKTTQAVWRTRVIKWKFRIQVFVAAQMRLVLNIYSTYEIRRNYTRRET